MRFLDKIREKIKGRKQIKEVKVKEIKLEEKGIGRVKISEVKVEDNICFECGSKFKNVTDKYTCKYCQRYFCSDHRLPERHNCRGNPKSPPHKYRVIIKGDERKIISK